MAFIDCELKPNPYWSRGEPCWHCPAITPVQGQNARIERRVVQAWDAGARSIRELGGNCYTRFTAYPAVGIVLGFAKATDFEQTDPATIEHGLYLFMSGGFRFAQPYESGSPVGEVMLYEVGNMFEIRREFNTVRMMLNNTVRYTSPRLSAGPLIVGACLYRSGDKVL